MKIWTRLLVAALVVWTLSSGPAWGNIVNGDFSDGLDWWTAEVAPPGFPLLASVDADTGQLHMRVENSCVSGAVCGLNFANVSQDVFLLDGGAPSGTTGQRFDTNVQITSPEGNAGAVAWVEVNYGGDIGTWLTTTSTVGTQTITINLPGLVETSPVLQIYLHTFSTLDPGLVLPDDTTYNIVVDAKFDNFEFIPGDSGVIPEPLTIFSAMLAVGGLGAYIRRRTAPAA